MSTNRLHPCEKASLFGRVSMGYAVIQSKQLKQWKVLLEDGLGMHLHASSDALTARLDNHVCRILIEDGKREDFVGLGLELSDEEALHEVIRRLGDRKIEVNAHAGELAALRGVSQFWSFQGPKGIRVELYCNPTLARQPLKMLTSGFVTGDQGFGHIAIVTRRPDDMFQFWQQVFDIRHTDDVHAKIAGVPLDFKFLRFNQRHHSIALASTPSIRLNPIRTTIQHMEVQAATLEDMTSAYERCKRLNLPIAMSVGQHANDRAVSFYVKTPSGFDIECGWNPIAVVEDTWTPEVWDRISAWGHKPEDQPALERVGQLGRALASLTTSEFAP